jgi:hypothetical protein
VAKRRNLKKEKAERNRAYARQFRSAAARTTGKKFHCLLRQLVEMKLSKLNRFTSIFSLSKNVGGGFFLPSSCFYRPSSNPCKIS